ncbi:MAG TPA: sugar phosphate isomerase/epimerase family protein [Bacteroidales bacterium]|nr:sugar phosphate isomerase/epimerase family protein [Bacteroidales bacterium]
MVKISAFADEVSNDFKEQLEFLQSSGIGWIEIRFLNGENCIDLSDEKLAEVKSMLKSFDIKVSALASPIGKYALDADFAPHFTKFRRAVEIAKYLDTKLIRMFSFFSPENGSIDDYKDEVVDRIKQMAALAEKEGVILTQENDTWTYGHSASKCVELIQAVHSPAFYLTYDPANFVFGEKEVDSINTCWSIMKPWVNHVHIKDWILGSLDIGSLPGNGDAQIEPLIKELAAEKYEGFLTLEPHMSSGGKFGGTTSIEQYDAALAKVRGFCRKYGMNYE